MIPEKVPIKNKNETYKASERETLNSLLQPMVEEQEFFLLNPSQEWQKNSRQNGNLTVLLSGTCFKASCGNPLAAG